MDTELLDAFIFLAIGIISSIIVYFIFAFLKKKAEKTETKMDDLIVYSLGSPLIILAFFVPLYFAIQQAIFVYPQYQWITNSNVLYAMYIIVATWIIATFVDGFLRTYGLALAERTETDIDDQIIEILQKIGRVTRSAKISLIAKIPKRFMISILSKMNYSKPNNETG
jgi:MscS family membrane protein